MSECFVGLSVSVGSICTVFVVLASMIWNTANILVENKYKSMYIFKMICMHASVVV